LKENLKNEKSLKNLLIRPLHPPKGVVVIYRSREELLLALEIIDGEDVRTLFGLGCN